MQAARGLAEQDLQSVLGLGLRDLEAGDLRAGLFAIAACLLHILAADEPGLGAEGGELERLGLTRQVRACDLEAKLKGAHLYVGERYLGDQRDARRVDAGFRRLVVGLGGLYATSYTPEQIELPAGIEADAQLVACDCDRVSAGGSKRAIASVRPAEVEASSAG